jgi:hypothetical protein
MPKVKPEPRVYTRDVKSLLAPHVRKGDEEGESVALIAEIAGTSTRTVYRVLALETETIGLDLADRLLVAVGENLVFCRVKERNVP